MQSIGMVVKTLPIVFKKSLFHSLRNLTTTQQWDDLSHILPQQTMFQKKTLSECSTAHTQRLQFRTVFDKCR